MSLLFSNELFTLGFFIVEAIFIGISYYIVASGKNGPLNLVKNFFSNLFLLHLFLLTTMCLFLIGEVIFNGK
tara:strand:- start:1422 stop:1637 length:216 start_codon:yes stop_codon:yes gene_type:complete